MTAKKRATRKRSAKKATPKRRATKKAAAIKPRRKKPTRTTVATTPTESPSTNGVSFIMPREELVEMAISAVLVGPRKGTRMAAMRLPDSVQTDAARASILEQESETTIADLYAKELRRHKVSAQSLKVWLRRVRQEFARLNDLRASSVRSLERALLDADLDGRNKIVNELLSAKTVMTLAALDTLNIDPEQLREIIRACGQVTNAAKVHTDVKVAKARIEKVRAEIDKLNREGGPNESGGNVVHAFFKLLSSMGRDDIVEELQAKGGAA
tara:strand:+ start:1741 stop:2550 length:810 start_codon:yes stop_codon:yes gene_type:complete